MSYRELVTTAATLLVAGLVILQIPTSDAPAPRETEVSLDAPGEAVHVVRKRTPGRSAVVFDVPAETIEEGHYVRFSVTSKSADDAVERWSCVAYTKTTECFARPLRIAYRDEDERVVLTVEARRIEVQSNARSYSALSTRPFRPLPALPSN